MSFKQTKGPDLFRSLSDSTDLGDATVWLKEEHLFDPVTYRCRSCGKRFREAAVVCPNCKKTVSGIRTDPAWVDEMVVIEEIDD
jgi:rubrerythrin